jgi:2-iminobutanoate/2-iminopropanoate deaminase
LKIKNTTIMSTPKKSFFTANAPAPIGPYSQAVAHNGILFVSGQIAIDPDTGKMIAGDIEKETERVMLNLKAVLAAAGCTFDNVIKASIFLKNMDDFAIVNRIYGGYLKEDGHYPARETVEVARLPKDANVEISVVAALNV